MGFFGGLLSAFGSFAPTLALDALSALLNAPAPTIGKDLANKSYSSDAYGKPWPRARGTVRLQAKPIYASPILASIHKTTSGGIFGIGQKSVYYNTYSASIFLGFGKKLGGGTASSILRIWADGKLLFDALSSDAVITGAVTVTVVTGGQLPGSQTVLLTLASGASIKLNPGDLVMFGADPTPYEVQSPVNATGPLGGAQSVVVSIWPPLVDNLPGSLVVGPGNGFVGIADRNSSPYDLSSFDPDPHDGSHPNGGYAAPAGGINFYLGSATQSPDPVMVKALGVGNVPGYRGLVGVMIHDLELANYGNRIPQFSAEIAFDTATPQYPQLGPIPNLALHSASSNNADQILLPFSGTASTFIQSPIKTLPYVWVVTGDDGTHSSAGGRIVYRVNVLTNQVEASYDDSSVTSWGLWLADADGYLYYVRSTGLNQWALFKVDGLAMSAVINYGSPNPFEKNLFDPSGLYIFDTFPSLFGNNIQLRMIASMGVFGGIIFLDRKNMLPLGTADPSGSYLVITEYDSNGTPTIQSGDILGDVATPYSGSGAEIAGDAMCVDTNGDIWILQKDTLSHYDCQFASSVDIQTLKPVLVPPTFARTDYSVSSVATGGGAIYYNKSDNSIIIFGDVAIGKFDIASATIILTNTAVSAQSISPDIDILGSLIVGNGTNDYSRVDTSTLAVTATYNVNNWTGGGSSGPAHGTFDQATNSVWYNQGGALYRFYLDRGNGGGVGLDSIVSSVMLDAGYSSGEFDVSQLTTQGITPFGWEFERQTFIDSLRRLMQLYLFDAAPIDGVIVFVPRGQAPIVTIPEDDLGALDDPSKYEARVVETLQDPLDTPESVWIKYYDPLRQCQEATQYAKRISRPYASTLSSGKNVTNSRQQLDIVVPVTENATPIRQQAEKILWDKWTGRTVRKFKLGPKYMRYDATDVATLNYKGTNYEVRFEEVNLGAGMAIEVTTRSQNESVYSSAYLLSAGSGLGSGAPISQPPAIDTTYTIVPASPLSEVSATDVHMVNVVATFSPSGRRAFYNPRDFTVSLGSPAVDTRFYVSVYDPDFTGEIPGTVSLTAFCDPNPSVAHVGQNGYIFMGTILVTLDDTGVIVTSGGSGNVAQAEGFYVNGSGGGGFTGTEDILDWMLMDPARRPSFHLEGTAANSRTSAIYSYLNVGSNSVAQIKSPAGWAADILLFDPTYVSQFITELDDPDHRDWSVNTSYKKLVVSHGFPTAHALPVMPRYFNPGQPAFRIDIPSPNPYNRYVGCSVIDTDDKGDVTNIMYGPIAMNLDAEGDGAGNLGDLQVMVNERYSGAKARERFYWGKDSKGGVGFVKWDASTLVGGEKITGDYAVTNWSVHNKLVAGGGLSPSFGCGYGVGWP